MKIYNVFLMAVLAIVVQATGCFAGGKREKAGEASEYSYTAEINYQLDALQSNLYVGNDATRKDSFFRTAMDEQSASPQDATAVVHISVRNVYSDPSLLGYGAGINGSEGQFHTKKLSVLTIVFYRITPGLRSRVQFRPIVGKLKTIKSEQQLGQDISGIVAYFGQSKYFRNLYLPEQANLSKASSSGEIIRALVDENYSIFFQEMPDEIQQLVPTE